MAEPEGSGPDFVPYIDQHPPPAVPASLTEELTDFYRIVAPGKAANVPIIAAKYAGQEDKLKAFLEAKYSVPGHFSKAHLQFCSKYFDPLAVLYSPDVRPPVKGSIPMDNIVKAMQLVRVGICGMVCQLYRKILAVVMLTIPRCGLKVNECR